MAGNEKGALKMKYYVITRFCDNGKVEAEIIPEAEHKGRAACVSTEDYDEYCDEFNSHEEAKKFADEAKEC